MAGGRKKEGKEREKKSSLSKIFPSLNPWVINGTQCLLGSKSNPAPSNPAPAGTQLEHSAYWVRNRTQHCRNPAAAGFDARFDFERSSYAFFIFIHLQKPND
ncbi:hypothetical protein SLEP1_g3144 [Rubroshorea leprosula]|uniref:Uncharacterized protein n=1 Tax=Rubroshorea leprosula TaxID=152421 RepID=A0AAV5HT54_9ROSI|nr:hypothetical protein SLEP1_g3144 [Rubroshorea leprosula]